VDPLAQLKDIHLPNTINDLPLAPGWWLLAVLFIVALSYLIIILRRYIQRNRARKTAIKQLKKIDNTQEIIALLKWAALQYFPRAQVAKLSGESFKRFLHNQLPAKHQNDFEQYANTGFSEQYREHSENEQIASVSKAAHLWLSYAIPVKKADSKTKLSTTKLTAKENP
jgi:hypothetical protein